MKELDAEAADDNLSVTGNSLADLGLDAITDAITGASIPKPIKRNVFKAFGRLCSAAVEVPAAYLEGVVAESKAVTAARVKLIETNATQIARQIAVDPEYARVAVRKFGHKILREQVNLDMVTEKAAQELKDCREFISKEEIEEIDDDWLNQFEKEASQRSSEDMQKMFGRILAGEIRRPSSFSIKAVKIMGEIDKDTAILFRRLCSACIVLQVPSKAGIYIGDARVLAFGKDPLSNALLKYGFSFRDLNILLEYGLIMTYNSSIPYDICIAKNDNSVDLGFFYQGTQWMLVSTEDRAQSANFRTNGVALSRAGKELLKVVDLEPIDSYTSDLCSFFEKNKLKMIPFSSKGDT